MFYITIYGTINIIFFYEYVENTIEVLINKIFRKNAFVLKYATTCINDFILVFFEYSEK